MRSLNTDDKVTLMRINAWLEKAVNHTARRMYVKSNMNYDKSLQETIKCVDFGNQLIAKTEIAIVKHLDEHKDLSEFKIRDVINNLRTSNFSVMSGPCSLAIFCEKLIDSVRYSGEKTIITQETADKFNEIRNIINEDLKTNDGLRYYLKSFENAFSVRLDNCLDVCWQSIRQELDIDTLNASYADSSETRASEKDRIRGAEITLDKIKSIALSDERVSSMELNGFPDKIFYLKSFNSKQVKATKRLDNIGKMYHKIDSHKMTLESGSENEVKMAMEELKENISMLVINNPEDLGVIFTINKGLARCFNVLDNTSGTNGVTAKITKMMNDLGGKDDDNTISMGL